MFLASFRRVGTSYNNHTISGFSCFSFKPTQCSMLYHSFFFVFYLSSILRYNIAIYIIQLLGDPENLCRGSQILFRIFPPTNE